MLVLHTLDVDRWTGPFPAEARQEAIDALERGMVIHFPRLSFAVSDDERTLFSDALSNRLAKNISLDPATGTLNGVASTADGGVLLQAMMDRFARAATAFVGELLPRYVPGLERARTSYRPVEIRGREASPRKNDRLLHVDAFPSRPTGGRRILRLFSNVDPAGAPRVWHVGEPFEAFSARFAGGVRRTLPGESWFLATLGITKGRRSPYDHLMLALHDAAKLDRRYQQQALQVEIAFPSGSSWLCYTDQVLHAAIAGQFCLEQTFHVDPARMADPARSPLRTLERITGHALT